jgi:2-polyprenyl-6-methoxyphenol hydroxylase-like FAD-dependent oxidoreductase
MSGTDPDEQVVVVGAGPVGLWLAAELRLAGVATLVVERLPERSPFQKALGIQPRTIEVLAMRGAEKRFLAEGTRLPSWHFGMLESQLDFRGLDTPRSCWRIRRFAPRRCSRNGHWNWAPACCAGTR